MKIIKRIVKFVAFKFKPFSLKQKKILSWWFPTSPVKDKDGIIADGAIRSGKTLSMAFSFVMWAMHTFDIQNFAMCGKTVGSFRRNVIPWLKLILWGRGYKVYDLKTENLITISKNNKVNYFYIFGGKDEGSQNLIQGITLAGVLFDEVALMPESFVNQATARCSVDGSKFWFNCNPENPLHWFKVNWIDKLKQKNILYLHFTMDDNLSLSEKIKERYRNSYFGVFYDRFIRGIWVVDEGVIYRMFNDSMLFDELRFWTTDDNTRVPIDYKKYIGIDYGTVNPMVFLEVCDDGKDLWATRLYYYDSKQQQRQKTDAQYADDFEEFCPDKKISIVIAPSAASFKTELKARGYFIKDANNEVDEGIKWVASMFGKGHLKICRNLKELVNELSVYRWNEKKALVGIEEPLKQFDHCLDALRYIIRTLMNKFRIFNA